MCVYVREICVCVRERETHEANLKSKLLVELDGDVVADLNVEVHLLDVRPLLAQLQHVLQHRRPCTPIKKNFQSKRNGYGEKTKYSDLFRKMKEIIGDQAPCVGRSRARQGS